MFIWKLWESMLWALMVHVSSSCLGVYLHEISIIWSTPRCQVPFSSQVQVLSLPITMLNIGKVFHSLKTLPANTKHTDMHVSKAFKSACKFQHHINSICHCDILPSSPKETDPSCGLCKCLQWRNWIALNEWIMAQQIEKHKMMGELPLQ